MNISGLVLIILTISISCCIVFLGPVLKKTFPRWRQITNSYFFWLILGSTVFIWLLVFRYVPYWKEFSESLKNAQGDWSKLEDFTISKAFLMDVCPLCSFFLCIFIICDPTRKTARAIAPLALMGGMFTVLGWISFSGIELTFKCIFIEDSNGNRCMIIMHMMQVFLSIAIMQNTPQYKFKGWLSAVGATGAVYFYAGMMMLITGCETFVSGLNIKEWMPGGQYSIISKIFHVQPIVAASITIPLLFLVACGVIWLNDFMHTKKSWFFGNVYSGTWYEWYDYTKYDESKDWDKIVFKKYFNWKEKRLQQKKKV